MDRQGGEVTHGSRVPIWTKSSYSDDKGGDCVEVAHLGSNIQVRDTKAPQEACISFSNAIWQAFLLKVDLP
ncbi:DUF397 domain-containing protein [Streptomyces sp. NPDC051554]|uniref:DUF397 domain-containing protein n=1 Tax=Streptomyces sp. NPDC051554 TaxID=3365656 RepID=UPI0037A479D2